MLEIYAEFLHLLPVVIRFTLFTGARHGTRPTRHGLLNRWGRQDLVREAKWGDWTAVPEYIVLDWKTASDFVELKVNFKKLNCCTTRYMHVPQCPIAGYANVLNYIASIN